MTKEISISVQAREFILFTSPINIIGTFAPHSGVKQGCHLAQLVFSCYYISVSKVDNNKNFYQCPCYLHSLHFQVVKALDEASRHYSNLLQ